MDEQLDLMAPEARRNPYPFYAQLRRGPIRQIAPFGMWAITRYDDVAVALTDSERFSSAGWRQVFSPPWLPDNPIANSLVAMDPPDHGRLRKLVNRAFTGSAMARLEEQVRDYAEALAERLVARREVEFVAELAEELPAKTLCHLLGFDPSLHKQLLRWADDVASVATSVLDEPRQAEVQTTVSRLKQYFTAFIEERRRQKRDDLISTLLTAEPGGERLSDDEIMSFLFVLLVGGLETSVGLLANAMVILAEHPRVLAEVRADFARIPQLVEEVSRYEPSIQVVMRFTTRAAELGGATIPAGGIVGVIVAAANRDERHFDDPDRFVLGRQGTTHRTFGHGPHYCLGALLARLQMRLGLEAILRRIGALAIVGDVEWRNALHLRVPVSLPMRLHAA